MLRMDLEKAKEMGVKRETALEEEIVRFNNLKKKK